MIGLKVIGKHVHVYLSHSSLQKTLTAFFLFILICYCSPNSIEVNKQRSSLSIPKVVYPTLESTESAVALLQQNVRIKDLMDL